MEIGGKMVAGEDRNRKALMKASELQTVQLLAAFRYPLDGILATLSFK